MYAAEHENMTEHDIVEIPRLLLTVAEASTALRLSRSLIYELIAGGRLRSVKIGGARRISQASLVEFVDQLEHSEPTSYPA